MIFCLSELCVRNTGMPFLFRRFEPKDKEAVFQLHVLALRDVSIKLYLSGSPNADNDLEDIEHVYL